MKTATHMSSKLLGLSLGTLVLALGQKAIAQDAWQALSSVGAPSARIFYHANTAIWTGSEMIIWGGWNAANLFNDGACYNPATYTWTPMSSAGVPAARENFTTVWTGTEMIIWGGDAGPGVNLNTGARYNPSLNTWISISTVGAPSARQSHTAVWTGTEMIVWGGSDTYGSVMFGDGARYNPVTDTWAPISSAGAPLARSLSTAIWTGTEMIIWGGSNYLNTRSDGARYNPVTDTWTPVQSSGAPSAREDNIPSVWTGSEMIIYGGLPRTTSGARYNPTSNTWNPISTGGAPAARGYNSAIWTGSEMIIWGGNTGGTQGVNDGARYNPASDSWIPMTLTGAPSPRNVHAAVWTGNQMIIWGGSSNTYLGATNGILNDTYSYTVPAGTGVFKQWDKVLGGTGNDLLIDARLTLDGGFIAAGYSDSPVGPGKAAAYGGFDYWVVKFDASANVQWERTFGGENNDLLSTALPLRNGGYLLAGTSYSGVTGNKMIASFGGEDIWLIRLDSNGNRLWERVYGGSADDEFGGNTALIETSDGGFLVGGNSASPPSGNKTTPYYGGGDVWVLKLGASGEKEWEQTFGGPQGGETGQFVNEVDESFFVAGLAGTSFYTAWSARLDKATGAPLTQHSYGAPIVLQIGLALPQGGYLFAGYPAVVNSDFWVTRVDALGNFVSNRTIGGTGVERAASAATLREGGYLVGGISDSQPSGDRTAQNYGREDYWLVKFDDQGTIIWNKSFGGTGLDWLTKVVQTSDGGILLGGYSDSDALPAGGKSVGSLGGLDWWIIKLGVSGDTTAPTIVCPADITVSTNPGGCDAVVSFTVTASDNSGGVSVVCNPPSGSSFPIGTTTVHCTATDAAGNTANCSFNVTVNATPSFAPATIWVGLKNSDDVGIRFDLRAEVYRNGTQLVATGELASVAGGSSGFNNAKQNVINLTPVAGAQLASGETLSIKLLVRNACTGSGKNSGTARLWFGDSAANSRFGVTICTPVTYYLRTGAALGTAPGSSRQFIDIAAGAKCSAYKAFGTWSLTLP